MFEKIDTERLTIRRFSAEDWEDLAEILTDKDVVYYEPYDVFTPEQCRTEAADFSENDSFYAVVLKSENKVIGKIYFNDEKRFDTYELGYTFNAAYQGRGYAKESSAAMIRYAFEEMGVRRIAAFADTTNERSWNLLEKLGMRREGCFIKKSYKFSDESGNPIWKNIFAYAILKEEFLA